HYRAVPACTEDHRRRRTRTSLDRLVGATVPWGGISTNPFRSARHERCRRDGVRGSRASPQAFVALDGVARQCERALRPLWLQQALRKPAGALQELVSISNETRRTSRESLRSLPACCVRTLSLPPQPPS